MYDSQHTGQHRRPKNPYQPTQPQPHMYPPAQAPYAPAPDQPARPGVFRWVALGLAIGTVIAGPVGCSVGRLSGLPDARSAAEISSPSPTRKITPIPVPSPSPSASSTRRPTKADVRLEVEETSRKCFGSAGCNVTYSLDAIVTNKRLFDPGTTYAITYKIQGTTQPISDTITLTDGRIPIVDEFTLYAVAGRKLTAVVTKLKAR